MGRGDHKFWYAHTLDCSYSEKGDDRELRETCRYFGNLACKQTIKSIVANENIRQLFYVSDPDGVTRRTIICW